MLRLQCPVAPLSSAETSSRLRPRVSTTLSRTQISCSTIIPAKNRKIATGLMEDRIAGITRVMRAANTQWVPAPSDCPFARATDGKIHDKGDKVGAYQSFEEGRKSNVSCACHWTVNQAAKTGNGRFAKVLVNRLWKRTKIGRAHV